MSWTQTAATQAAKDAAAAATQQAHDITAAQNTGLTDRVRALFYGGGIRTWSIQELRTALDPNPPSVMQINGAVYGLMRRGEVVRTTEKKTGWGKFPAACYRRAINAVDET